MMAEETSNLNDLLDEALEDLLQQPTELQGHQIEEVDNKSRLDQAEGEANIATVGDEQPTPSSSSAGIVSKQSKTANKKKGKQQQKPKQQLMPDEEEMDRFFASMTEQLKAELPKIDPDEAQAKINESVPQIFDLMQNLLSKELLYPALKDLAPKFDEWLSKNGASLSKEDKRRYKKQVLKINEIIQVFDDETLDTQERFEKNLDLMEQMQSLGAPPDELTVPEGMTKCSIM